MKPKRRLFYVAIDFLKAKGATLAKAKVSKANSRISVLSVVGTFKIAGLDIFESDLIVDMGG